MQTKSQLVAEDVAALLRARNPLIWIVSREEARVESYLVQAAAAAGYMPRTWDVAQGLVELDGKEFANDRDIADALNTIKSLSSATVIKPKQTVKQRVEEVKKVVEYADGLLKDRKLKVVVDRKTGAIAFDLSASERDGVTDACMYRRIMATGSSLAKAEIARAEQMAGRTVNKQALTAGVHSHDGGKSWHHGH